MQEDINNLGEFTPYIGVKLIKALPFTKGDAFLCGHYKKNVERLSQEEKDEQGYLVDYGNYISWSPKKVFEDAYFGIEDLTKITRKDVESFIVEGQAIKMGEKTTIVMDSTLTGFDTIATSACVDPANFDLQIGADIARRDITDKIWGHLGFVLQWAKNGLKAKS